ncbi:MAG: hypothetical protein HYX89_08480 [Chloroflexi bacterium]|nr:hypothetical protein [Chloroflexota bacterium]
MELREYWQALSRRWWVVLIALVAAAGASYGFSRAQEPVYRSTTRLMVTPARPDAGQTIAAENLIRQYLQQVTTSVMAQAVNQREQLDLSNEALLGKIKASASTDDKVITIEVDDTDPQRSRVIAAALADELEQRQWVQMQRVDPRDRIDVTTSDPAKAGTLIWPKTRTTTAAGAFLGLLAGFALAFLLEYLDDTFKSADEVERRTQLSVLGMIPSDGRRA